MVVQLRFDYMELKKLLHAKCLAIVQQRINDSKQAMNDAQESANQEEKSSAGDKYETGRAMAQITRDQIAQQLDEVLKLKSALEMINPTILFDKFGVGSLVIINQNRFYVSVSLGKLEIEGKEFF